MTSFLVQEEALEIAYATQPVSLPALHSHINLFRVLLKRLPDKVNHISNLIERIHIHYAEGAPPPVYAG
jgi:hypothetical protein